LTCGLQFHDLVCTGILRRPHGLPDCVRVAMVPVDAIVRDEDAPHVFRQAVDVQIHLRGQSVAVRGCGDRGGSRYSRLRAGEFHGVDHGQGSLVVRAAGGADRRSARQRCLLNRIAGKVSFHASFAAGRMFWVSSIVARYTCDEARRENGRVPIGTDSENECVNEGAPRSAQEWLATQVFQKES